MNPELAPGFRAPWDEETRKCRGCGAQYQSGAAGNAGFKFGFRGISALYREPLKRKPPIALLILTLLASSAVKLRGQDSKATHEGAPREGDAPGERQGSGDIASDAIARLKKAVELNPRDTAAREALIQAEAKAGDTSAARQAARDALELFPDNAVALDALKVSVILPADPVYWLNLSAIQYRKALYLQSIDSAEKALLLKPRNASAYNNIGAADAAMGKWDEAIRNEEKALELQPDFPLARNNLAWARSGKAAAGGARGP